jgi:hypothetical protein
MRYQIDISGRKMLLTQAQTEALIDALQSVDILAEKHVGTGAGSQGYQNSYVPIIEHKFVHEFLAFMPMHQNFYDTIKLSMKLDTK